MPQCRFESCRAYHSPCRSTASTGGFGERRVRVCNGVCDGLGHNVARVGMVWHNLAQRFGVVAGLDPRMGPPARRRIVGRGNVAADVGACGACSDREGIFDDRIRGIAARAPSLGNSPITITGCDQMLSANGSPPWPDRAAAFGAVQSNWIARLPGSCRVQRERQVILSLAC